jgi:hypothetical protein
MPCTFRPLRGRLCACLRPSEQFPHNLSPALRVPCQHVRKVGAELCSRRFLATRVRRGPLSALVITVLVLQYIPTLIVMSSSNAPENTRLASSKSYPRRRRGTLSTRTPWQPQQARQSTRSTRCIISVRCLVHNIVYCLENVSVKWLENVIRLRWTSVEWNTTLHRVHQVVAAGSTTIAFSSHFCSSHLPLDSIIWMREGGRARRVTQS